MTRNTYTYKYKDSKNIACLVKVITSVQIIYKIYNIQYDYVHIVSDSYTLVIQYIHDTERQWTKEEKCPRIYSLVQL